MKTQNNYIKKFKFNHAIMFHNFHDNKFYKKNIGTISSKHLEKIIKFIGPKNISNPDKIYNNFDHKQKKIPKVFFTFDDGLKCHMDIVLPVLQKYNIKAFFFIFTNHFENSNTIETMRFFRENIYKNINLFYKDFFNETKKLKKADIKIFLNKKKKLFLNIKKNSPYYSNDEINFRIIRNSFLTTSEYERVMLKLYKLKKFNHVSMSKKLYLNKKDMKKLISLGHEIGLHSHSHDPQMEFWSYSKILKDFKKNNYLISKITNKQITSCSLPFGIANKKIYSALKKEKINVIFKKNLKDLKKNSLKFIPRINHNYFNDIK